VWVNAPVEILSNTPINNSSACLKCTWRMSKIA
jgi:hypothetical protein